MREALGNGATCGGGATQQQHSAPASRHLPIPNAHAVAPPGPPFHLPLQRRQGRDFAFWLPMQDLKPGAPFKNLCSDLLLSHTLVAEHSETCRAKRAKVHLRETQVLPYNTGAYCTAGKNMWQLARPLRSQHAPRA